LSSREEPILQPMSVSPDDKLGGIPFLLAAAQREVSSPKRDSTRLDDDDDKLGGVRNLLAASQATRSISRKPPPPPPQKTTTRRKKRIKATLPMYGNIEEHWKSEEHVGGMTESAENGGRESATNDGERVLRRKTESAEPSLPPVKLEPSEEELKSAKHDRARNALMSFYQRLNEFCAYKAEFGHSTFTYTILEVSSISFETYSHIPFLFACSRIMNRPRATKVRKESATSSLGQQATNAEERLRRRQ
jgi:hypothetical protein